MKSNVKTLAQCSLWLRLSLLVQILYILPSRFVAIILFIVLIQAIELALAHFELYFGLDLVLTLLIFFEDCSSVKFPRHICYVCLVICTSTR